MVIRKYIDGSTLQELIEREQLTVATIDSLFGLIVTLSHKGLVIADMNPANLVYCEDESKWYIIDGKIISKDEDWFISYRNNLQELKVSLTNPLFGGTFIMQLFGKGKYRI